MEQLLLCSGFVFADQGSPTLFKAMLIRCDIPKSDWLDARTIDHSKMLSKRMELSPKSFDPEERLAPIARAFHPRIRFSVSSANAANFTRSRCPSGRAMNFSFAGVLRSLFGVRAASTMHTGCCTP